jgi:GT2 family glycosyltransferase
VTRNWNITIIVLNWNGRAFIGGCLDALLAQTYPNYSITVVDNASSDDSIDFIRERFPQIEIICSHKNLGFAAGNNIALRRAEDDLIALVNPDVILPADWLQIMVNQMALNEQIGIAGCKLLYPESNLIQHAGGFVTHPLGLPGHHGFSEKDQGQYNTERDVEYVIGAGMCIRRRMLDEIGLFDEGFFLFFEDADLCFRARNAGYRIAYIPEAVAYHSESVTTKKGSPSYLRRFHTSRWRWLIKHFEPMEIIKDTMEAESDWLSICYLQERIAAGYAYASTMAHFDEIIQARISDKYLNQEPLTEATQNRFVKALELYINRLSENSRWMI